MVIFLSPSPPKQCGSCIKNFAQRKRSKTRRKKTRKYISCDVGSVEKLIEEEAEDACARPHSGDNNSTKEEDNRKRNEANNETANSNEEASIGGSGFPLPSLNDSSEGGIDSAIGRGLLIDSQSSNNNDSTSCIGGLNNDHQILIEEEDEDTCVGSPRENRCIVTGNNEFGNEDNNAILLRILGADLRRFDKYKTRLNLRASPLWYKCKKHMSKQKCIEVGWVSISSHLLLYTMHLWSCRKFTQSSLI
jgi:hypothetical protein